MALLTDPGFIFGVSGLAAGLTCSIFAWRHARRLQATCQSQMDNRVEERDTARGARDRFELLVQATPFPIVITSADDGYIRFANEAADAQFKITPSEQKNYRAADFYLDRTERDALVRQLRKHGRVTRYETRMRDTQGTAFWVEITGNLIQYGGEACLFAALTDVTDRKEMMESLRHLADTDPLTLSWNRRKFMERLDHEHERLIRYSSPVSVINVDIDHFKDVNDTYGHAVGDDVLCHVARTIRQQLRGPDILARLGGEEFSVLLPETRFVDARQVGERIRATIEHTTMQRPDGNPIHVTISAGVSELVRNHDTAKTLHEADDALYLAKRNGRNQVATPRPYALAAS